MTAPTTPRQWAESAREFLAQSGTGPFAPVRAWADSINDAIAAPGRAVALRSWLTYVRETYGVPVNVETLQVRFGTHDFDHAVAGVWIPGPRQFTRYVSSVQFFHDGDAASDFSTRYFSGLKVVASSPTVWVGWDTDARTVIVYRVQEG